MKKDWSQIILALVAITLFAANIFLVVQNTRLKRSLERSKQFVTEEGYKFSTLAFHQVDSGPEELNLADGKLSTLLLVFNSSCQYCDQQYPHWIDYAKNLDASRWRVMAVTAENDHDKLRAHIRQQGLSSIKTGTIDAAELRKARMLFTPMTILVNAHGEVEKVWPGLWTKGFDASY